VDICLNLETKTDAINRGLVISKIRPCPSRTINTFGHGEKDLKMGKRLFFPSCYFVKAYRKELTQKLVAHLASS
jgi:hypothetical protein